MGKNSESSFIYLLPDPNTLGNVPTYAEKQRKTGHLKNLRMSRNENGPS